MCHNPEEEKKTQAKRKSEVLDETSDDEDEDNEEEAIHIKHKTGISKVKIKECIFCSHIAMNGADLKTHVHEEHAVNVKNKTKNYKHNRSGHGKDFNVKNVSTVPRFNCEECNYSTKNQAVFNKHQANKHNREEFDIKYSVESLNHLPPGVTEADLTCVCTWCRFKSNQYKVVRKHIDIHHEAKKHFPCKECYFVAECMEDYAKHYNDFHKADNYPHACSDCNFK